MNRRAVVLLTAVLGGLAWVLRWVLADRGAAESADTALFWAGLVLLAVAVAGLGAGLVSSSATWLQAIVAVAFPLLVWSVIEVLKDSYDEDAVDAVAAVVVVVLALLVARRRGTGRPPSPRPRSGAHAR
ncbi:MAG TPA: hypothetical protein VFJ89_06495 [Nocardioides sp.]|nr:hypothetical protein [Nocardioides sp.]